MPDETNANPAIWLADHIQRTGGLAQFRFGIWREMDAKDAALIDAALRAYHPTPQATSDGAGAEKPPSPSGADAAIILANGKTTSAAPVRSTITPEAERKLTPKLGPGFTYLDGGTEIPARIVDLAFNSQGAYGAPGSKSLLCILTYPDGSESVRVARVDGRSLAADCRSRVLYDAPEILDRFVNVYRRTRGAHVIGTPYASRDQADAQGGSDRTHVLKLVLKDGTLSALEIIPVGGEG